jgi:hypothetical protein
VSVPPEAEVGVCCRRIAAGTLSILGGRPSREAVGVSPTDAAPKLPPPGSSHLLIDVLAEMLLRTVQPLAREGSEEFRLFGEQEMACSVEYCAGATRIDLEQRA